MPANPRSFPSVLALMAGLGVAQPASAESALTWGKPAEITGFDVHVAGTVASWEMYQMVYETLLTTDDELNLQPGLAESWEEESPTRYIFTLREGAAFSNGRAVDAGDVIGSIERIQNPETASYWAHQLGEIVSMEALDDRRVAVELARPHATFLPALAHITAAIIPVQEYQAGEFNPESEMLGSGPFMVEAHDQDERWTLVRNPHYGRDGYPRADRLNVAIIPDESARMAALRDGRIDFTTFENPDAPQMLGSTANVEHHPIQTTNYYRFDVNALSEDSPFNDRRVRQAMNLALDREAINMLVFNGTSAVDYPVPAAFGKDACQDLDTYALPREERLERARELLADAGQPAPQVELMASSANQVLVRIAEVAQQSLAEAGFDVRIAAVPTAEYLQRVFTDGDFDFSASWLAGYTDPSMVIQWWNPNFAVWNLVFQEEVPELSEALAEVRSIPDSPERDQALRDICAMIDEGANLLALVSKIDYVVYRADQVEVKLADRTGSANTWQYIAEFAPVD
jgi:peptide/nickel transport system substrate-binding protein